MLQAHGLTLTVDPRLGPLFSDVTLSVSDGEKVVLIGNNGSGKSLLLRILAGRADPNSGRVVRPPSIGYLAQDFDLEFGGTLRDLLERDQPDLPAYRVAAALHRLGLDPSRLEQPYRTLSLGERMRGALAALLVAEPEVLLLDEPTNHLDQATRQWLTEFLTHCPEACLVVTHDRAFADAIADRVLELARGQLTAFRGNLSEMRAEKALQMERQRAEFERQKREDHRLRLAMEAQYQRAADVTRKPTQRDYSAASKPFYAAKQAKMDKRAAAVRSRLNHAAKESVVKPFEAKTLELEFPTRPLRSVEVLRVRGLTLRAGNRTLVEGFGFSLDAHSRVAVLGPNGAGKTTLFRTLIGELPALGEVAWSSDVQWALLTQGRERLPVRETLREAMPGDPAFVRSALGRLGMRGDIFDRPVGTLSVGERTKAEIVAMMADGANVLILDEPTNHLDLASLEALESALADFPGAVLFTSHDAEFVRRVATEVVKLI